MPRKRAKITVTLPADLHDFAIDRASERQVTLTQVVEEAMTLYVTGCLYQSDTKVWSRVTREDV